MKNFKVKIGRYKELKEVQRNNETSKSKKEQ